MRPLRKSYTYTTLKTYMRDHRQLIFIFNLDSNNKEITKKHQKITRN